MLKSHMDVHETALVAISKVPANSGHSLHKGTPREAFIKKFLESHLPATVAIGSGEIIDANSKPGEKRNQFDIVIYKKSYPKLDFGGDISGFLVESVIATIEVKSTLTKADLEQAIKAARNAKSLTPNVVTSYYSGHIPPKVLNYVVAYEGPQDMRTVFEWVPPIHASLGITIPNLPVDPRSRANTPSPSIDGVFVLQKGFLYFDNVPMGFVSDAMRSSHPDIKWFFATEKSGSLLVLFLLLQAAMGNIELRRLDPLPYMASFQLTNSPGFGLG